MALRLTGGGPNYVNVSVDLTSLSSALLAQWIMCNYSMHVHVSRMLRSTLSKERFECGSQNKDT